MGNRRSGVISDRSLLLHLAAGGRARTRLRRAAHSARGARPLVVRWRLARARPSRARRRALAPPLMARGRAACVVMWRARARWLARAHSRGMPAARARAHAHGARARAPCACARCAGACCSSCKASAEWSSFQFPIFALRAARREVRSRRWGNAVIAPFRPAWTERWWR